MYMNKDFMNRLKSAKLDYVTKDGIIYYRHNDIVVNNQVYKVLIDTSNKKVVVYNYFEFSNWSDTKNLEFAFRFARREYHIFMSLYNLEDNDNIDESQIFDR